MTKATRPNPRPASTTVASLAAGERGVTSPKPRVVSVVPLTYKSSAKPDASPSGSLNSEWIDQVIRAKAKTSDMPQTANSPSRDKGPKIERNADLTFGRGMRSEKKQQQFQAAK